MVFIGNVVARALGFAFPLALAHLVERPEFAVIYFFVSTGFFAGELVLSGFPVALTRQLAADQTPARGRWLVAGLAAGLPLLAVSLVAGELLAALAAAPPLLMSIIVVGLTIDAYYFSILRGLQSFRLLVSYRIAANVAQLALLLLIAALGLLTVAAAVAIYGLSYLVPIILIELRRGSVSRLIAQQRAVRREELRVLARFAVPALISGTAYGFVLGADVFFVGLFAPTALADYGAARALALPLMMVPYAVGTVLLPRASGSDLQEKTQLLKSALLLVALIGITAAALYILLGSTVVSLLLPPDYQAAPGPLRTIAPALAVFGAYSVLSQWWFALGRPLVPALCLTIGAMASVASHALVTSRLGAEGGGIAIGSGAATALIVLGFITLRRLRAGPTVGGP